MPSSSVKTIPFTVSLSGLDAIDKAAQVALLPNHMTISKIGGIHEYDKKIRQLQRQGTFRDWWWSSTTEEFVCAIFGALARRYWGSTASNTSSEVEVVLSDRGIVMFEAITVAMIALKQGDDDLDAARSILTGTIEDSGLYLPRENCSILIRHSAEDPEERRVSPIASEDAVEHNELHARYQRLLQAELLRQEARGLYHHVITISSDDRYCDLQDRIRDAIFETTKNSLFRRMMFPVQTIYGLTGTSKAGKSRIAQEFCSALGAKLAFHAKVAYFNDLVSLRLGKNIHCLPEEGQALHLLHELESFGRTHEWLRVIAIESLDSVRVISQLKGWLGDRLRVVYVDTKDSIRVSRSGSTLDELSKHDKFQRLVDKMRIIAEADMVLDNNGEIDQSVDALFRFATHGNTSDNTWTGRTLGSHLSQDGTVQSAPEE
ncbi:hypothetical protein BX600DRAFT_514937 [Xylariales sp. PMI_506]|nr:hypothetical protein BX600DRAFT_514937 [Xylariales sp. PMI_506]